MRRRACDCDSVGTAGGDWGRRLEAELAVDGCTATWEPKLGTHLYFGFHFNWCFLRGESPEILWRIKQNKLLHGCHNSKPEKLFVFYQGGGEKSRCSLFAATALLFLCNIWVKLPPVFRLVSEKKKKKTKVGARNPSCFTDSGKSTVWHLQSLSTDNPTRCQLEFVWAASQPINCMSSFTGLQSDELTSGLQAWPLQISLALARQMQATPQMVPFHLTDHGNFLVWEDHMAINDVDTSL